MHDCVTELVPLVEHMSSIRSSQTVIRHLERLERSQLAKRRPDRGVPSILGQVESMVQLTLQWIQQLHPMQQSELAVTKMLIHRLCAYMARIGHMLDTNFDLSLMTAWISATQELITEVSVGIIPSTNSLLPRIQQALTVLSGQDSATTGRACALMWQELKPRTPQTMVQLHALLGFEELGDRFDRLCWRFDQPLANLVGLRLAFLRSLTSASGRMDDIDSLTQKLQTVLPPNVDEIPEETVPKRPHFATLSEQMCRQFALLSLVAPCLAPEEVASLELYAKRSTKSSISNAMMGDSSSTVRADFHLLGCALSQSGAGDTSMTSVGVTGLIFQGAVSVEQVSLANLDMLESEGQTIGRVVSTKAHLLFKDVLPALDACLERLLSALISLLATESKDVELRDLAADLGSYLKSPAKNDALSLVKFPLHGQGGSPDTDWMRIQCQVVIAYLRSSRGEKLPRSLSAARAWASFALLCLTLYVPEAPFDPAMKPRLQRDIHRQCLTGLLGQLQAIQTFRASTTGDEDSLRARGLLETIDTIGPEPHVEEICRPEVSEMKQLQGEFDGLMRTVQPLCASPSVGQDPLSESDTIWSNVDRIRTRLQEQYRAYDDLTGPVIAFIDCLRLSRELSTGGDEAHLEGSLAAVQNITPFVKASLGTWLIEDNFVSALSGSLDQETTLYMLSVLAARCSVIPMSQSSPALRRAVDEAFVRFYQQWKLKLSDDQRRAAANSSLYRFKGDADLEDDASTEELEELFPTSNQNVTNDNATPFKHKQDHEVAYRLSQCHRTIFEPRLSVRPWDNLQAYAELACTLQQTRSSDKASVPATIFSLDEMQSRISNNPEPNPAYNMYSDANPAQVRILSTILRVLMRRFEDLREAWPEHATPIDVLRLSEQILTVGHADPLTTFLPLLEKLHATVSEWQKIASKEFSVNEALDQVTSLIVSWRQLELSSWAGLLNREDTNCEKSATSWWYIAYENIIAASRALQDDSAQLEEHAEGLLKTLEGFMASCGLGEFLPRLNMLRDFVAHLAVYAEGNTSLAVIHQALSNFVAYHQHFEVSALEKLAKGRAGLEKDIKNVIQVASWKDRNIETLRQSAKSSHKKLLRLIRKYRIMLAEPIESVVQAGIPQKQLLDEQVVQLLPEKTADVAGAEPTQSALSLISTWSSRPDRFLNISATTALMVAKTRRAYETFDAPERISSYIAELAFAISELQTATPSKLTDDNKEVVQHLKTRKRRLLADVLKDVRTMGFQSNLGDDILAQQGALHTVLAKIPALNGGQDVLRADAAEHSLHRLLSFMPVVRAAVRKHSEDLTPAEVARCLNLLESILRVSIDQRKGLCKNIRGITRLQATLSQVSAFASCKDPAVGRGTQPRWLIEARAKCLVAAMATCVQLIESQSRLSAKEYSAVLQNLRQHTAELENIMNNSTLALPKLPAGISSDSISLLESQFNDVVAAIEFAAIETATEYPELEPVLSQLSNWSHVENDALTSRATDGGVTTDPSAWVGHLLQDLDYILGATQEIGKSALVQSNEPSEKAWLVTQSMELFRHLDMLRLEAVSDRFESLLQALPQLAAAPGGSLDAIASMSRSILPIINTFMASCQRLLIKLCTFHVELNKLGFRLADIFVQLARRGFCAPPEKSEGQKEKPGEVESGTGLGEGEGGEDISKDIGDDEDLSELAQEAKAAGQTDDIEDEEDAVDMADQEMEGELGDAPEASEDEGGGADEDPGAQDGIDEEAGEVDDLGATTVDEKMWDEGKDDERTDKEVDDAKGTADEQNVAAGKQGEPDESEQDTGHKEDNAQPDTELGADEAEEIEQQATETVDPHVEDQQTLDLPQDIDMDGQKMPEDDATSDGLSDMDADEQQSPMEEMSEEAHGGKVEAHEEPVEEEIDGVAEAGEEAESAEQATEDGQKNDVDDATSDILMREDHELERPDDTMFGESGLGAAEQEATAPRPETAPAAQQHEDEEGASEQQGEPEAGASGQQRGTRTEDANASADKGSDDQPPSAYKQIGDVLEEWYKRHQQIEAAQQQDDPVADRADDVNMAEASFEHLLDDQTAADTQALGTASADQSTALDEESGLTVNDELDTKPLTAESEIQEDQSENQTMNDEPDIEPSDILRPDNESNIFVGEAKGTEVNADIEMNDELTASEDDDLDSVDIQLSNTHLELLDEAGLPSIEEARALWSEHEARTRNLSLILTEHLRLILQPTQATKMRGDFRTGKRLNIKRIIPYIASSYKRDKIWMRRSVPSKRSYQIMLAIDDSKSMAESDSRDLAFETLALVAKSMSMLEVGELSVIGFGENINVAHDFSTPFTSEAGAEVFRQFKFCQRKTNVRKLLAESIELFRSARLKAAGSASDLWQLQLIISDGVCEDHPSIRQLVRQAHEERIMAVFVVVDAAAQKAQASGGPKQSILDLQFASFVNNELVMKKYLDTFPFSYYLVVRDVQELPGVLAGALRQWFAEVVETGGT